MFRADVNITAMEFQFQFQFQRHWVGTDALDLAADKSQCLSGFSRDRVKIRLRLAADGITGRDDDFGEA